MSDEIDSSKTGWGGDFYAIPTIPPHPQAFPINPLPPAKLYNPQLPNYAIPVPTSGGGGSLAPDGLTTPHTGAGEAGADKGGRAAAREEGDRGAVAQRGGPTAPGHGGRRGEAGFRAQGSPAGHRGPSTTATLWWILYFWEGLRVRAVPKFMVRARGRRGGGGEAGNYGATSAPPSWQGFFAFVCVLGGEGMPGFWAFPLFIRKLSGWKG